MGPLNSQDAVQAYLDAVEKAKATGGKVETGGAAIDGEGNFVLPTIITGLTNDAEVVQTETFAPILYVMKYGQLDEAIDLQNDVPQGLSSSIFTQNLKAAEAPERFAPVRSAPTKRAPNIEALSKLTRRRVVPDRSARKRSAPLSSSEASVWVRSFRRRAFNASIASRRSARASSEVFDGSAMNFFSVNTAVSVTAASFEPAAISRSSRNRAEASCFGTSYFS